MDSRGQMCHAVIAEITRALREQSLTGVSQSSYQHLSACSRCRAGLLLLVRGFDPEPDRSGTSVACERCQTDLAAFIDLEASDPKLAANTYPHVWWHLWICSDCSQTYEMTQVLLSAQQAGAIQPVRLPARVAQQQIAILQRVSLTRQALALALPGRQLASAVSRGSGDRGYVLYDDTEDEPEHRQFMLVAEEQNDGFWQIRAVISPPPDGLLVLTAGTLRFVAPFGPDGTATIAGIAPDVLTAPDAPNLEISIVPADEF